MKVFARNSIIVFLVCVVFPLVLIQIISDVRYSRLSKCELRLQEIYSVLLQNADRLGPKVDAAIHPPIIQNEIRKSPEFEYTFFKGLNYSDLHSSRQVGRVFIIALGRPTGLLRHKSRFIILWSDGITMPVIMDNTEIKIQTWQAALENGIKFDNTGPETIQGVVQPSLH